MRFSLPSINCSAAAPSFRLLPTSGNQIFEPSSGKETVLGSSRKKRAAAEYLIDSSAKRICQLSPHVIETRSSI